MLCYGYIFDAFTRITIRNYFFERFVASTTRRVFWTLARCMAAVHSLDRQRYIELRAKIPTVLLEVVRSWLYAMVNVDGVDLPWPLFGTRQQ